MLTVFEGSEIFETWEGFEETGGCMFPSECLVEADGDGSVGGIPFAVKGTNSRDLE
jgi:hypothetical protein